MLRKLEIIKRTRNAAVFLSPRASRVAPRGVGRRGVAQRPVIATRRANSVERCVRSHSSANGTTALLHRFIGRRPGEPASILISWPSYYPSFPGSSAVLLWRNRLRKPCKLLPSWCHSQRSILKQIEAHWIRRRFDLYPNKMYLLGRWWKDG